MKYNDKVEMLTKTIVLIYPRNDAKSVKASLEEKEEVELDMLIEENIDLANGVFMHGTRRLDTITRLVLQDILVSYGFKYKQNGEKKNA